MEVEAPQFSSTASSPVSKRAKLEAGEPDTAADAAETRMTEARAGITAYIDPDLPGFQGIIKQRFTDFMVNEIDLAGNVCRLTSLDPPAGKLLNQLRPEASSSSQVADAQAENPSSLKSTKAPWPSEAESSSPSSFHPTRSMA